MATMNGKESAPAKIVPLADVARVVATEFDDLTQKMSPVAAMRDMGKMFVDASTLLLLLSRANESLLDDRMIHMKIAQTRHAVPLWVRCVVTLTEGLKHLRTYYRWPWENSAAGPYAAYGWPVFHETAFGWPGLSALHAVLAFAESVAQDTQWALKESVRQTKALPGFAGHAQEFGLSAADDLLIEEAPSDALLAWRTLLRKTLQTKVETGFPTDKLEPEAERLRLLIAEEYRRTRHVGLESGRCVADTEAQTPLAERGTAPVTRPLPAGAGNADMPTSACETLRAIAAALTMWAPFHAKGIAKDVQRSDEAKAAARKAMRLMVTNLGLLQKCRADYGLHSGLNMAFTCLGQVASWPDTRDLEDCWNWGVYFTKAALDGGTERSFIEEVHRWANRSDQEGLGIADVSPEKRQARGGRKALSKKEADKRRAIIAAWREARDRGIDKYDFCDGQGISVPTLDKYIDWGRKQNHSE